MNTMQNMTPDKPTFEDVERIIQRARRMRSQALADMGIALRSFLRRWTKCALLHIGAALRGKTAEQCA